jgi:hypothetical protein
VTHHQITGDVGVGGSAGADFDGRAKQKTGNRRDQQQQQQAPQLVGLARRRWLKGLMTVV